MSNINTVAVSGNLTRDPEFKQINDDFAVCKFGIAVNRNGKKNDDGSYEEKVSFFDVEVLGNFASLCGRKLKRGDSATITGRLEQQSWENEAGEKRSKVVIIPNEIDSEAFFRPKDEDNALDGSTSSAPAPAQTPVEAQVAEAAATDDDIPF